ncbi:hypothetical protein IWX90DRAFT_423024 [Phyllosticta citrichinensis]|uniref:Uncharacterized protein n=1 Tax=Phyllosticta citrichinensis TaxID=1130410 RepID=A0ABR1Y1Z6_9PEZI
MFLKHLVQRRLQSLSAVKLGKKKQTALLRFEHPLTNEKLTSELVQRLASQVLLVENPRQGRSLESRGGRCRLSREMVGTPKEVRREPELVGTAQKTAKDCAFAFEAHEVHQSEGAADRVLVVLVRVQRKVPVVAASRETHQDFVFGDVLEFVPLRQRVEIEGVGSDGQREPHEDLPRHGELLRRGAHVDAHGDARVFGPLVELAVGEVFCLVEPESEGRGGLHPWAEKVLGLADVESPRFQCNLRLAGHPRGHELTAIQLLLVPVLRCR